MVVILDVVSHSGEVAECADIDNHTMKEMALL